MTMREHAVSRKRDQDSPLLIIVEDSHQLREQRVKFFSKKGFAVIAAASMEEALHELQASPGVDLVVTDIELDKVEPHKSGVALARKVREFRDQLPIVGYSAKFEDLPEADRQQFQLFQKKGTIDRQERDRFADRCLNLAVDHRDRRRRHAHESMARLRHAKQPDGAQFRTLRRVAMDRDGDGAEATLERAGFRIRLIDSENFDSIVAPFVVWIRQGSNNVEAEVYGQPELYTVGADVESTVQGLVEYMRLSLAALLNGDGSELSDSAEEFLLRVVARS